MKAAKTTANRTNPVDNRLWISALAPVFAWIAAHQLNFLFSPWVCATGRRWVLYAVTGAALLAALAGGAGSWKSWKELPPGEGGQDPVVARRRFMAAGGLLLAVVFSVAIVALVVPAVIHRPCD
jgi:hypothetical protein